MPTSDIVLIRPELLIHRGLADFACIGPDRHHTREVTGSSPVWPIRGISECLREVAIGRNLSKALELTDSSASEGI